MARTKSQSKSTRMPLIALEAPDAQCSVKADRLTPCAVAKILRLALKDGVDLAGLVCASRTDCATECAPE